MKKREKVFNLISSWYVTFDYGVFLPFVAKLPLSFGRKIALLRGRLYGLLKRDWRSFCLGDTGIYSRLEQSYATIHPQLSAHEIQRLILERYAMQSVEEWEGACLANGRSSLFRVRYKGLEALQAYLTTHKRVVFLTAHFGSSILGITFLQKLGMPLLVMSSNVIEDERVYPVVSRFFDLKYRGIDTFMNGGEVLHREGNMRRFLKFAKEEGSVVIIGDLPPSPNESPVWVDFFGKERGFASGATKLAESANIGIIPFVCTYENGEHVMKFGSPNTNPYEFLRTCIHTSPSSWWAGDLLPALPIKEELTHG